VRGLSRRLALVALVLLLVAAGLGAFLATRLTREAAPPPRPAVVIPERRPDVTLSGLDGQQRSLSHWDGRALIVNFWATWCAPCRREIPLLNELAREFGPRGFTIVGIAVDFRDDVLGFLRETPIGYETLVGEEAGMAAARAFGVANVVLPFTAFTDRSGRIVTLHIGELHRAQAEAILETVRRIDAGDLELAAGRKRIEEDLARLRQEA